MRKYVILGLCVLMLGCSTGQDTLETYVSEPEFLIRDPHFNKYKSERDELERQYIHKDITYAEYLEQKKELDDEYAREVQRRENILSDSQ